MPVLLFTSRTTPPTSCGAIEPEDKKAVTKLARAAVQSQSVGGTDASAPDTRPLSERLARALTAQCTVALQAVLIERTDVALTIPAFGLVSSLWGERYWRHNAIGIRITDTLTACYLEIKPLRPSMIEVAMSRAGFAMVGARSRGFGQYVQHALSEACCNASEMQRGDHGQG